MSVSVSLCVCLSVRDHIFATTCPGRVSVLWWRSDTLCISGFVEDVIFAHKPRLLDVAVQLKRSAHAALAWV